jgi:hypothetical protein
MRRLRSASPNSLRENVKRLLLLTTLLALIPAPVSASCGFGCLHRQIEAIRRQTLPVRVLRLEERLSADESKIEAQSTRIAVLEGKAATAEAKALSAFKCFAEIPLTRYGEETGPSGYLFNLNGTTGPQTLATTALDLSYPDDAVGTWVFVDACNKERLTQQSSLARYATRFVETGN